MMLNRHRFLGLVLAISGLALTSCGGEDDPLGGVTPPIPDAIKEIAKGCGIDVATGVLAVGEYGAGHTHQATPTMTMTAKTAAAIIAGLVRSRRGAKRNTFAVGRAATASGESA